MIDKEVVKKMADLAHIKLKDTQIDEYTEQIAIILKYFEEISQVDTEGIEPLVTPTEIEPFWREDEITKEFTSEEMVSNAPLRVGNLFKVPPAV